MKIAPIGTFPRIGRVGGSVFTAPGLTNVGRTRIAPVQPRTNAAAVLTASVGVIASLWNTLSDSSKATWTSPPNPPSAGYPFFVAYNTPLLQWGLPPLAVFTFGVIGLTYVGPFLYSEPDGVHTTLNIVTNAGGTPGWQTWVRAYLKLRRITGNESSVSDPAFSFVGSFGPLVPSSNNYFDFTQQINAYGAPWLPPTTFPLASNTGCGIQAIWSLYNTDQIGRPAILGGPYPIEVGTNVEPTFFGSGACPLPGSPPYPWPPSH
jgi:hypothetical protein